MKFRKQPKKRSPLKSRPLRQAGQSVQERIDKLLDEGADTYILVGLSMIGISGYEWLRWWQKSEPHPVILSAIALAIFAYCLLKVTQIRKRANLLKLGRDGERAVGEYLERLRERGCIVFHDIVGDGFNIDHVVLSDRGIFSIETKTYSKPRSRAEIISQGGRLLIDGLGDKSTIIDQIIAGASWLGEMLRESTGRRFPVKPVVVFPGWYVHGGLGEEFWVLNPKALPPLLEKEAQKIKPEDVRLAAFHLSRFIRSQV